MDYSTTYTAPTYTEPAPEAPKKNALEIVSLVCGILGLLCCGCNSVFGIAAVICGFISKKKSATGKLSGMAIAGIIMGFIAIVAGIIICAINGAGIVAAGGLEGYLSQYGIDY